MSSELTLSVAEVAKALGISKGLAYAAMKSGTIPSVKVGRRILVPRSALAAMLAGASAASVEVR